MKLFERLTGRSYPRDLVVRTDAFKYQHNASANYQICTFSVSERLLGDGFDILSFRNPKAQESRQPSFVKELFAIKGVDFIEIVPYEIRIGKARVYEWSELIDAVEAVIREYLRKATTQPHIELVD